LHMMKGTPYIYQGEEIGMTNTVFSSIDDCKDIEEINAYKQYVTDNKIVSSDEMLKCFNAVARDNARTPMQWDDSKNSGFTTGTPWIKVNDNYREINTAQALKDKDSIFYYYKELIRLRHEYPIIVYGKFVPLMTDSDTIYAYERVLDGQTLTVACNWTDKDQPCTLFDELNGVELISNYKEHEKGTLKPFEATVVLH
nr:glucohydrolase [Lachnospiraceae bacterium]